MHRFHHCEQERKPPSQAFGRGEWGEFLKKTRKLGKKGNSELIVVEFAMSCYNAKKTLSLIFQVNIIKKKNSAYSL